MGTINIFRVTDPGDDETVSDRIDFNTSKITKTKNAFITGIKINPTDGIGNNQGAEQNLGDQQALGLVEKTIKFSGFISARNADSGLNTFLVKLKDWADEPKINSDWELGRFGFTDADDSTQNVIPDESPNTIALLWERIEWTVDFKGNRNLFDLYFRVNLGDGT